MDFLHVGMKVHDIERPTRFYTAVFGITWEPVRQYLLGDITLNGDMAPSRTLVTHGKTAQGFEIEMVQVLEGEVADDLALGDREGLSLAVSHSEQALPYPPSSRIVSPVRNAARSEHRNAASHPISTGSPQRPVGSIARYHSSVLIPAWPRNSTPTISR